MSLDVQARPLPLLTDADGVVRIGGTRVTLDTLVEAFEDGASAEEIAHQYPSLRLSDVYAVIGYYLDNRASIDAYLRDRSAAATAVRAQNEAIDSPVGIRERLLARRTGR